MQQCNCLVILGSFDSIIAFDKILHHILINKQVNVGRKPWELVGCLELVAKECSLMIPHWIAGVIEEGFTMFSLDPALFNKFIGVIVIKFADGIKLGSTVNIKKVI